MSTHIKTTEKEANPPDVSWPLPRLADYYCQMEDEAKGCQDKADWFKGQASLRRFRQGHVLKLVHSQKRAGGWIDWLDSQNINRMTANRWLRLFAGATAEWGDAAEKEVIKYSVTELYNLFGIAKSPAPPPSSPAQVGTSPPEKPAEAGVLRFPVIGESESNGEPEVVPEPQEVTQDLGKRYKLNATVILDTDEDPQHLRELILTKQVRFVCKNSHRILGAIKLESVQWFDHV